MNSATRPSGTKIGSGPVRGSFPADHLHECDKLVELYFTCLKVNDRCIPKCRRELKAYMKCRKERDLMSVDDFVMARLPSDDAPVPEFSKEEFEGHLKKQKNQDFIPGVRLGKDRLSGVDEDYDSYTEKK